MPGVSTGCVKRQLFPLWRTFRTVGCDAWSIRKRPMGIIIRYDRYAHACTHTCIHTHIRASLIATVREVQRPISHELTVEAYVGELLQREIREPADRDCQLLLWPHYQEQQDSGLAGSQIVPQRLVRRVADHFALKTRKRGGILRRSKPHEKFGTDRSEFAPRAILPTLMLRYSPAKQKMKASKLMTT